MTFIYVNYGDLSDIFVITIQFPTATTQTTSDNTERTTIEETTGAQSTSDAQTSSDPPQTIDDASGLEILTFAVSFLVMIPILRRRKKK